MAVWQRKGTIEAATTGPTEWPIGDDFRREEGIELVSFNPKALAKSSD